jgi:hypothetical protein
MRFHIYIMSKMAKKSVGKKGEKKLIKCPFCGNNELERLYSEMNVTQASGSSKNEISLCQANGECSSGTCPYKT